MSHDRSLESMTAATKDSNATFLFVTLDWSPASPDLTRLQGDWETVSLTESGKQLAIENGFGGLLLQIKGDTFVIAKRNPDGMKTDVDTGRIEIDSTATPKTIDFIGRAEPRLGIYELKHGVLRVCLIEQAGTESPRGERIPDGKPVKRPTSFDSPAGSNILLMEFQHKQPDVSIDQKPQNLLDTTYISNDTVGLLVAHPQRILSRESAVKDELHQRFARVAETEGLDVRNINQIVVQLGPPPLSSRPIRNLFDEQLWTVVLRFDKPFDVESYIDQHAQGYTKTMHKHATYYHHDSRMEMWFPDKRTLILAVQQRILNLIDNPAKAVELIQFERDGSIVTLESKSMSRILALTGQPIGEPVAGQGPFVMNTREEIQQAMQDYQAGKMGHLS